MEEGEKKQIFGSLLRGSAERRMRALLICFFFALIRHAFA